jgi:hypothetical protein
MENGKGVIRTIMDQRRRSLQPRAIPRLHTPSMQIHSRNGEHDNRKTPKKDPTKSKFKIKHLFRMYMQWNEVLL